MAKPLDPPPTDNAPADAKSVPETKRAYMTLDTWTRLRAWFNTLRQTVRGIVNTGAQSSGTSIDGLPLSGWAREGSDGLSTLGPVVAMNAGNASTQSFANNTPTTVTNWTKIFDTANAFNATTGVYTVPVGGLYSITANLLFNSVLYPADGYLSGVIYKNGTAASDYLNQVGAATTAPIYLQVKMDLLVQCIAGDTLYIQAVQSSSGTNTLYADSTLIYNRFSVLKVG